jgi:GMP synthase PP-ATPase subunit
MSKSENIEDKNDNVTVPGWVPHLTAAEISTADLIAKKHLGSEATAATLGARARGSRGDAPHYGDAVVINDPDISEKKANWEEYLQLLDNAAYEISGTVHNSGNVVIDITDLAKPQE